jgi:hypothetical protein
VLHNLGEAGFRHGRTLRRASGNTNVTARRVPIVFYLDEQMRLLEPQREAHRLDWQQWSPGTQVGEVMASPKNPVLYPA